MANNWWESDPVATASADEWWASDPIAGEQNAKEAGIVDRLKDTGIDVAKGFVGAGEALVGVGNLVSGNLVGDGLAKIGYDPKRTKEILSSGYSEERQAENAAVRDAEGFVGTARSLLENPAVAVGSMVESAPMMLGSAGAVRAVAGGMLARAGIAPGTAAAAEFLKRPEVLAKLATVGSAAEGATTAGSIQEQARQEGSGYADSAGYALAGGAGTALIGKAASKLLPDADVIAGTLGMGGRSSGAGFLGAAKGIGKGMVQEGVLEEMPQSAQEQVFTNLATSKPWNEGVAESAAQGLIVGAAMGGGVNLVDATSRRRAVAEQALQQAPDAASAAAAANEMASVDLDAAVNEVEQAVSAYLRPDGGIPTPDQAMAQPTIETPQPLTPQEKQELARQQLQSTPVIDPLAELRLQVNPSTTMADVAQRRDAVETSAIERMLAEDMAKAEAQAQQRAQVEQVSAAETTENQLVGLEQKTRERMVNQLMEAAAEPSGYFASRMIPAIDQQLAVLKQPPLTPQERERVVRLTGAAQAFTKPTLPEAPAPAIPDRGADNTSLEARIPEKIPRPTRILGQPTSSYTDDQLTRMIEQPDIPAVSRRGASIELSARQAVQSKAATLTNEGTMPQAAPVLEQPQAQPAPVLEQPAMPAPQPEAPKSEWSNTAARTNSWVIRNKETGEVVAETYDPQKVEALNTAKYAAVPIEQHLASLSQQPAPQAQDLELNQPPAQQTPAVAATETVAQTAPIQLGRDQTLTSDEIMDDGRQDTTGALFSRERGTETPRGSKLATPSDGRIVNTDATATGKAPVPGSKHTVQDGETSHSFTVVDASKLGAQGRLIQQIARIFGKRVVAFQSDTLQADGFVLNDDQTSIYLNVESTVSPLAVFGHELTHQMKKDNPQAYAALEAVVQRNMDEEGMTQFRQEYGEDADIEELSSDLVGNRFREPAFWEDVFNEIAAQNPTGAAAIVQRVGQAIRKAVDTLLKTIRQQGFNADAYVTNLEEIRDAVRVAMVDYSKQQREPAMAGVKDAPVVDGKAKFSNNRSAYDDIRRRLSDGRGIDDDSLLEFLAGQDRRKNARWGYVADRGGLPGVATIYWRGEVAGESGYYTAARFGRNGLGERSFMMGLFPASELTDGSLRDVSRAFADRGYVWYLSAVQTKDGSWEVGTDGAEPGSKYRDALLERGEIAPAAGRYTRFTPKEVGLPNDLLREGMRRLSLMLGGKTPDVVFTRETGARPRDYITTIKADRLENRFSRRRNYGTLTSAQEEALRNVGGIKPDQTVKERFEQLRSKFDGAAAGMADQFAELEALDKDAYMEARLSKGTDGTLEALMLYGKPFITKDGAVDVDIGDEGFAKVLGRLEGEQDRFLWWVAAQRAERLKAQGLERLFSDQDITALKELNRGNLPSGTPRGQAYARALQEMNDFNDAVLKVAEQSGLIDPESRKLFKDTPYVPFYRVMDEEGGVKGPSFSGGLTNQYAWKKLKGGKQKLNEDLLSNVLMNWSHLYAAAAKNRAATAALKAGVRAGIAERVPSGTKGSIRVRDAGKEVHYLVSDEGVMAAISAIEYKTPRLFRILGTFKRMLSMGVTASPTYKVKNLIRDSVSAVAISDLSFNVAGNVIAGYKSTSKDSQTFASMLAGGGLIRFGAMLDGNNADRTRKMVAKEGGYLLDREGWKKVSGMVADTWDAYNELGDRLENANRAALYEQLMKKGYSQKEANFMARDLMDFTMQGRWAAVRFLTEVVPFMNARIQGLYKLGKAAKADPQKFGYVVGAVALASIALLTAYEDDEDWKKRPDWDRDTNWWFKIGGVAFRIPKPFEVGAIGTLAERGWELAFNKEMDVRRFGRSLSNMIFDTFAMDPTPQIVKPLIDIYANRAGFTNGPIESIAMQRLRPQDRYDERTSYAARFLGQIGLPSPMSFSRGQYETMSPKQIDYLVRGYFGWLGTAVTTTTDIAMRPMMGGGERPDMRLRDMFFVGNFVETLPSGSSRYLEQVYEQSKEIEQAYNSHRAAIKRGDREEAAKIFEEEKDKIRAYKRMNQFTDRISDINGKIKRVESSQTLSGESKRKMIDQLNEQRNKVAERASKVVKID